MTRCVQIFIFCTFPIFLSGQFFDGFNDNLDDWTTTDGNSSIIPNPSVEGIGALRLGNLDPSSFRTFIFHNTVQESFGSYSFQAMADGPQSDVDFYFQYINGSNHYALTHKPGLSDNPELVLYKVVNNDYTELWRQQPIVSLGQWFETTVVRSSCSGSIEVFIDGDLIIDVVDADILQPGAIGFGTWQEFAYFDSLAIGPEMPRMAALNGLICSGSGVAFGGRIIDIAGVYMDTIKAPNACDTIVTLTLAEAENSILEIDTILCPNETLVFRDTSLSTDGQFFFNRPSLIGCDTNVIITVQRSLDTIELGVDQTICPGESLDFSIGPFDNILWSTGEITTTVTVQSPQTLSVTAMNTDECLLADTVEIIESCDLVSLAANIFSPNGDNLNDTWRPTFNRPPTSYELVVYDRWGNLVFQSTDVNETWNGRFEGSLVAPGIYVWRVNAEEESFNGDILLIK